MVTVQVTPGAAWGMDSLAKARACRRISWVERGDSSTPARCMKACAVPLLGDNGLRRQHSFSALLP